MEKKEEFPSLEELERKFWETSKPLKSDLARKRELLVQLLDHLLKVLQTDEAAKRK